MSRVDKYQIIFYRRDIILALKDCPFAPSVAMQDTPQQSVSSILGRTRPDQEEDEGDRDAMLEKCINREILAFSVVL